MAASPDSGAPSASPTSLPQLILELRDLVLAYVRQETLEPLKSLGRYVAYGLGGALLLGTGVLLLAVGELRLLQVETGTTFQGDWSWAPYAIVVATLFFGAAIVWSASGTRKRD